MLEIISGARPDSAESPFRAECIRNVHLEVTERCNAACPACGRNIRGGKVNPHLSMAELSVEDVREILPSSLIAQLKKVYLCGNYGDPAVASDTAEILSYLRESSSKIKLGMNTNGAIREADWWREIAPIFSGANTVKFAIDGLEDTNSIYRRNTNWKVLMRNVTAFIDAGGQAEWHFLVFRHNEHQLGAAERLAKELGFASFVPKKSGRFIDGNTGQCVTSFRVDRSDGLLNIIELPRNPLFVNKALGEAERISESTSLENYYDKACVDCKAVNERGVYISAEGLVLPCCWVAGSMYPASEEDLSRLQIWQLIDQLGGKNQLSAIHKGLDDIVDGAVFAEIANRWKLGSIGEGKLRICSRVCGDGFDQFSQQYE